MKTPWGPSDSIEDIGDGILSVTTPSHGGYYVPARLLERIPKAHQEYAARWSGSPQWYEEDVAWAAVALAFPHIFPRPEMMEAARATAAHYFPAPEPKPYTGGHMLEVTVKLFREDGNGAVAHAVGTVSISAGELPETPYQALAEGFARQFVESGTLGFYDATVEPGK